MKKLLVILCLPVLLMISCKQDEGPRPVAEKFLTVMQAHQYEEAGKYGTDETLKLLKQFEKIEKLNGIASSLESTGKITILSEDIKGKTAEIDFNGVIEEGAAGDILLKRIQQIVNTATQFETVDSIIIKINGQRRKTIGGDGYSIGGPLRR